MILWFCLLLWLGAPGWLWLVFWITFFAKWVLNNE